MQRAPQTQENGILCSRMQNAGAQQAHKVYTSICLQSKQTFLVMPYASHSWNVDIFCRVWVAQGFLVGYTIPRVCASYWKRIIHYSVPIVVQLTRSALSYLNVPERSFFSGNCSGLLVHKFWRVCCRWEALCGGQSHYLCSPQMRLS